MEVAMPALDFNFTPPRFTPYGTAPTTPRRSGEYYFSAPNSPKQLSQFYRDYDDFSPTSSVSSIPFGWEERPGTPKSPARDDFAFDVGNSRLENSTTIPAEELFDGGKIRHLKPPPGMGMGMGMASPRSPISSLSPRRRKESDPFEKAVENTVKTDPGRGRERESSFSHSSSRRGVRSQSPYRVSKYSWEEEVGEEGACNATPKASTSISSKGLSRKWRLRDFFLFRSASEGRAGEKDPARKYTRLFKKHEDNRKHSSFRSIDGLDSGTKKKGSSSAHEYYKVNKVAGEDLKKKSFLPYKQGILGRLGFNPIGNGFGFSRK